MTYRLVACGVAAICAALFAFLMLIPAAYPPLYGVESGAGAAFVGRRFSGFLLGLGAALWLARDLPPGRGRDAVCFGVALAFTTTALTGVCTWLAGSAGPSILGAAAVELAVAAALVAVRRRPV